MRDCTGKRIPAPRVGDRVMEKPFFGLDNPTTLLPGTVVAVNRAHGHYTVRFDRGYRENFRITDWRKSE